MTQTTAKASAPSETSESVSVHDRSWSPFWTLCNEVEDLFDDFFRSGRIGSFAPLHRTRGFAPRALSAVPTLDVIDKEYEVKLSADLPGLSEDDIDVQVSDSTLTISGEKKEEIEDGDLEAEQYISERRFGSFTRRIPLPDGIDQNKIDASFKNGVLTVHLPKKPEAQHPARKIEVKAGG